MKLICFDDISTGNKVFVAADHIVALTKADAGTMVHFSLGADMMHVLVETDVEELASLIERYVPGSVVSYLM